MRKVWICAIRMDCPAQSSDRFFAQQIGFVANSMDCPLGTLRKVAMD